MKKTLLLLLVLFTWQHIANAQVNLSWSDFKGTPDLKSPYDAMTFWNVYYSYDAPVIEGDKARINFTVWCELDTTSWVKTTIHENQKAALLKHEQGHLIIGHVCALALKKKLTEVSYDANNYKIQITEVFNKTLQEYQELEIQYDQETNHSKNKEVQKKWDDRLSMKLKEMMK